MIGPKIALVAFFVVNNNKKVIKELGFQASKPALLHHKNMLNFIIMRASY